MVVTKPEDYDNKDGIADKPIEGIYIFTAVLYLSIQIPLMFPYRKAFVWTQL